MKRLLFLGVLFSLIFCLSAQEVQFPPSILAAGGGVNNSKTSHVSKWRIGRVNVLYLNTKDFKSTSVITHVSDISESSWEIQVYPNPVTWVQMVQVTKEQKDVFIIGESAYLIGYFQIILE